MRVNEFYTPETGASIGMKEIAQLLADIRELQNAEASVMLESGVVILRFTLQGEPGWARFRAQPIPPLSGKDVLRKKVWSAAKSQLGRDPKSIQEATKVIEKVGPMGIKILTNPDFLKLFSAKWAGLDF